MSSRDSLVRVRAHRYCVLSRGALHMLARLRDDLAGMTMAKEDLLSVWAEEGIRPATAALPARAGV
jgi:hypothetical protein